MPGRGRRGRSGPRAVDLRGAYRRLVGGSCSYSSSLVRRRYTVTALSTRESGVSPGLLLSPVFREARAREAFDLLPKSVDAYGDERLLAQLWPRLAGGAAAPPEPSPRRGPPPSRCSLAADSSSAVLWPVWSSGPAWAPSSGSPKQRYATASPVRTTGNGRCGSPWAPGLWLGRSGYEVPPKSARRRGPGDHHQADAAVADSGGVVPTVGVGERAVWAVAEGPGRLGSDATYCPARCVRGLDCRSSACLAADRGPDHPTGEPGLALSHRVGRRSADPMERFGNGLRTTRLAGGSSSPGDHRDAVDGHGA